MKVYLDTSAAMKLLIEERESAVLAAVLDALEADDVLCSSWLLHAELHCAAARRGGIAPAALSAVLDPLLLLDLERVDLVDAPLLGRGLRSQDAIHLAAAHRIGADQILTYDDEQSAAARLIGMTVLRPE